MYSQEELREFLTLLLSVAISNGLSAAAMATVLGVTHPTVARWMRMARTAEGEAIPTSVYRYMADPVRAKLRRLVEADKEQALFSKASTERLHGMVALLKAALAN